MSDSDSDSSCASSDSSSEDEETITRREYNRKYYQKNRQRILASVLKKVECPHCNRKVNSQNLRRHQMSSRCVNKDKLRQMVMEIIGTYQK
jgi:hypothetical protein